ncbi:low affinity immunoglobulin gamma Fc region receptor II-a-like isoform X1 [Oryzias melastigma]|uniref:low affinity immunoglobulin gamma Fc region receptor II-a-like isoform X1 n=1 Tax=Oryzias melastigma TaxID=30732 RepID=UPI00168CC3AC|nr:low affinity immunoglobulin gamma Fc region receptor II-a-like isoform X1 [Oryzias melastigma]
MRVTALCFLSFLIWDSAQAAVLVRIEPNRLQFFKYESFSVSCEDQEESLEAAQLRVMKMTQDGELHPCSSPCSICDAFPATDSGKYWCETDVGTNSSEVNITVTAGSLILETPVHPVTKGEDATLTCRCKDLISGCSNNVDFYKDGIFISTSSPGTMNITIQNVSRSDQGLYKCSVSGVGESPGSWVTVRAPSGGLLVPRQDSDINLLSGFGLIRHLVVATPYVLSTILLGLIFKDQRKRERGET